MSIIIPVYNGANYMRKAIDSALAQTYPNTEIIVVNDGSRDDGETEKIALSYGDKIRYIHKENGGVSSALNTGIRNMKGKYFSWLSHDDEYLPEKVYSQVKVLESTPDEKTIAICGMRFIDSESKEISKKEYWGAKPEGVRLTWEQVLSEVLINSFGGCTLLIPKDAFDISGLFDESLRYSQDYLMWVKIFLNKYSLIRSPGSHVCGRIHQKQLTQTGSNIFHSDSLAIAKILLDPLSQVSDGKNNFLKIYAVRNAIYDNPKVVDMYLARGKELGVITLADRMYISFVGIYGAIRPAIKKLYYKLVRKISMK